jgi:hypothetical protein
MSETLWVGSFDTARTGFSTTGTSPYLDAQDEPTNYVSQTGTPAKKAQTGDYYFDDPTESGDMVTSTIGVYFNYPSTRLLQLSVSVNNGTDYTDYTFAGLDAYGWVLTDVSGIISHTDTMSSVQVYFQAANAADLIQIDAMYHHATYAGATTQEASFQVDTILSLEDQEVQYQLDTILQTELESQIDLDTLLKGQDISVSIGVDTWFKAQGLIQEYQLDSLLKGIDLEEQIEVTSVFEQEDVLTYLMDALLKETKVKGATLDTLLNEIKEKGLSIDTLLSTLNLSEDVLFDIILNEQKLKEFVFGALFKGTGVIKQYSLDSIFKAGLTTQTVNYLIDAILKGLNQTKTYTIDSIYRSTEIRTYVLDALLRETKSHGISVSALLLNQLLEDVLVDVLFKGLDITKAYTVDTLLQGLNQVRQIAVDTIFATVTTSLKYASIDSRFIYTIVSRFADNQDLFDLIDEATFPILVDTIFKVGVQTQYQSFLVSGIFRSVIEKLFGTDAVFKGIDLTKELSLDALLMEVKTLTATMDTILKELDATQEFTLDALFFKEELKQIIIDTVLKQTNLVTMGVDALFLQEQLEVILVDIIFSKLDNTKSYTVDALLVELNKQRSIQIDVILKKFLEKNLPVDTILQAIDFTKDFQTDLILKDTALTSMEVDSLFMESLIKSYVVDTILRAYDFTKTYSIDTVLTSQFQELAMELDALLIKRVRDEMLIDTLFKGSLTKQFLVDVRFYADFGDRIDFLLKLSPNLVLTIRSPKGRPDEEDDDLLFVV